MLVAIAWGTDREVETTCSVVLKHDHVSGALQRSAVKRSLLIREEIPEYMCVRNVPEAIAILADGITPVSVRLLKLAFPRDRTRPGGDAQTYTIGEVSIVPVVQS